MATAKQIIREIIDRRRKPQPGDRALILNAMMRAPFCGARKTGKEWGETDYPVIGRDHPSLPGTTVGPQTVLTSIEAHVIKRIADNEWIGGTSPTQYLADIRTAVQFASMVKVGEHRRPAKAGSLTPRGTIHSSVLLPLNGKEIFVVYNAEGDYLQSAYSVAPAMVPNLFRGWTGLMIVVK